jgi:hypothetical protein
MRTRCALIVVLAGLTACDLLDRGSSTRSSGSNPGSGGGAEYTTPGDVSLRESDGGGVVSSEQYRQWYTAHQGLDRRISSRFGALLQPSAATERTIDRAVAYLNSEPRARDAIRRSGMSVRDFVVTTVALEQEMRVASQTGIRPIDTMRVSSVYPYPYPYPSDTMAPSAYGSVPNPYPLPPPATPYPMTPPAYTPPPQPTYPPPTYTPPAYSLPQPRDTARRVDTVYVQPPVRRDTTPSRPLFPARDTMPVRRDTSITLPRRDTTIRRDTAIRRDTTPRPIVPRDTNAVDTLRVSRH